MIFSYYTLSFEQFNKDNERREKARRNGKWAMRFFIFTQAIRNVYRKIYTLLSEKRY